MGELTEQQKANMRKSVERFGVSADKLPKNKDESLLALAREVGLIFKEDGDYVTVSIKPDSVLAGKCAGDKTAGRYAKLASGSWIKQ